MLKWNKKVWVEPESKCIVFLDLVWYLDGGGKGDGKKILKVANPW